MTQRQLWDRCHAWRNLLTPQEKKILTQTRCNLLSGCQHLECWQGLCTQAGSELPSLSISEVALIAERSCNLFLQLSLVFRFWLPGGRSSSYSSGTSGLGCFLSSDRVFRRSGWGVGPASPPYLQIPSALALGNRHGLSMGSDV